MAWARRAADAMGGSTDMIRKSLQRAAVLLAAAGLLAACCTPSDPQSVQPGSGTCGAYIPITTTGNGGGAQR